MTKAQQNQYRMAGVLDAFLETHDLKASPVAVAEADDVRRAYLDLQASIGQGTTSTKENTADATAAEDELLKVLPALLGSLRAVARKLPLTDPDRPALLARVTISAKQLERLRPASLRDVVQHLLTDADTYQKQLANYGYSPAVHSTIAAATTAFAATVGTTRVLQNTSSSTHRDTVELLRELMKQCYELDDAMDIFRVLDHDLYLDYRKARKVGKSGGGKGKPAADGGAM